VYEPENAAQAQRTSAKETIAQLKRELLERKRDLAGASFMEEEESDSRTERFTQAPVRTRCSLGGFPSTEPFWGTGPKYSENQCAGY
jgi:hypothetical protein